MVNRLYIDVTGCSQIQSVGVTDSHSAATATATINCLSSSLDVGDYVEIDLGYTTNHNRVFAGYVKSVQRSQSPTVYEISCASVMVRAVDYFLVSNNPEHPYSKENISAEGLISDLMDFAGLTNQNFDSPGFTFATRGTPVEVNLVTIYDYCKFIADIIAWSIWADQDGVVHFASRPPFPDGSDSVATLDNYNLITVNSWNSDRDLRNRVVVYGAEGIHATAEAASPYLPDGFFKSIAVAAPTVITSQSMADRSADYNLALLNRLTVGGSATILGDPTITCRDNVTVNKPDLGMTGKYYVFGIEHDFSKEGYKTNLDLRQ